MPTAPGHDDAAYVRCGHCRGFYESGRGRCRWCRYDTPLTGRDGQVVVYPNRATARAVQVAEYERLPPEAHADHMKPPPDLLDELCACLHCGPAGRAFEAVEMRWHTHEQMWACPCTTCGGRGFEFDIFPITPRWTCARCGHRFKPEHFTSNYAHCPRCGGSEMNGWHDDEGPDGEPLPEGVFLEDITDDEGEFLPPDEYAAVVAEAVRRMDEADAADAEFDPSTEWDPDEDADAGGLLGDPSVTFDGADEGWYPGKDEDNEADAWREETSGGEPPMPDDIDHPRTFPRREADSSEGDIPF